jgi:WD40 repeat protein
VLDDDMASVPDWVTDMAWSPIGERLALGDRHGWIRILDAAGNRVSAVRPDGYAAELVAWSPHGDRLAICCGSGAVWVWAANDTSGPVEIGRVHAEEQEVAEIAWSPDGVLLAGVCRDHVLRVWLAARTQQPTVLPVPGLHGLEWSDDGRRLAGHSGVGDVYVWARNGSDEFVAVQTIRRRAPEGCRASSVRTPALGLTPRFLWRRRVRESLVQDTADNSVIAWWPGDVDGRAHPKGKLLWAATDGTGTVLLELSDASRLRTQS